MTIRVDTFPTTRKTLDMEPTGTVPPFRSEIPLIAAPDRAAWPGGVPFVVEVEPKFLSRARGCVERDRSAIAFDPAIVAQSSLHDLCSELALSLIADGEAPEGTTVHFDPTDEQFWAYPPRE